MNEPFCPHCNEILSYEESYDLEFWENNIINRCFGHCSKCNRTFVWEEKYVFDKIQDCQEIEE